MLSNTFPLSWKKLSHFALCPSNRPVLVALDSQSGGNKNREPL